MRIQLAVCCLMALCSSLITPVVGAQAVKLNDGTPVTLRLEDALRSGREKVGSRVRLKCSESVSVRGRTVVVEQGALAGGTITKSSKGGMFGKRGKIDFEARWVEAVDGSQVPVRSTVNKKGKDRSGWGIWGAALLVWPLIFVKGGNANIPEGFEFPAYIDGNHEIEVPVKAVVAQSTDPDQPAPVTPQIPPDLDPLVVSDVSTFKAADKAALVVFSVENPNDAVGLRGAHVSLTALDEADDVVGSNASLTTMTPEQTIYWLGPQQRALFVKRMGVRGPYSSVLVHVSQAWVAWDQEAPEVSVEGVEVKGKRVVGEARNDSEQALTVELMVVATQDDVVTGAACGVVKNVPAGGTKRFELPLAGSPPEEAAVQAFAVGVTDGSAP